ncbi:MAG TPA: universal stress protein [Actinomycetota bacterium]|nr:universal stress protein [Actinomycetota bacterium]
MGREPEALTEPSPAAQGTVAPHRILVAADGSDGAGRATRLAVRFLRGDRVEARVLTVLSFEMDPYTLLGEVTPETQERLEVVDRAVERATEAPRRILEEAGHRVAVVHRFGNPADEILADIDEWGPDLVVIGRRGLAAPSRWLLGSVSERVLRHGHVPVLVGP